MKENFLSEAEVNALLKKKSAVEDPGLDDREIEILGAMGQATLSTVAADLSAMFHQAVSISPPRVHSMPFHAFIEACEVPKVLSRTEFKEGFQGSSLLLMDVKDASVIADLMKEGDGATANETLSEQELLSVSEVTDQMFASMGISMAQIFGRNIAVSPVETRVWDAIEPIDAKDYANEDDICMLSFQLSVEGWVDTEMTQVYSLDTVREWMFLQSGAVTELEDRKKAPLDPDEEIRPDPGVAKGGHGGRKQEKRREIQVEKPVFAELHDTSTSGASRNLDLIMDVPLEFSVVLGKTRKTIQEVLALGAGSVVELSKLAEEPLEIFVNGKLIAHGEVVVINENFGIRVTQILSKEQRVRGLK